jgi:hypothetical protein
LLRPFRFLACWVSLTRAQHIGPTSGLFDNSEKRTSLPVFGLDNPNIRIEADLAQKLLFGFGRLHPRGRMEPWKEALLAILKFALSCRTINGGGTAQIVDLDKNRAGFSRSAAAQPTLVRVFACASLEGGLLSCLAQSLVISASPSKGERLSTHKGFIFAPEAD